MLFKKCNEFRVNNFLWNVRVGPNPVSNGSPLTVCVEDTEFSNVIIVLMDI